MSQTQSLRTFRPPYSRKRDSGGYHSTNTRAYNWSGGASPPAFPSNWVEHGLLGLAGNYTSMSDVVTPGYKERIAAGAVINNGMSKVTMKLTPYTLTGNTVRQVVGTYGTLSGITGYRWAAYDLYGDWFTLLFGQLSDGFHTSLKMQNPLPFSAAALYNKAAIEALNRVSPASSQSWVTALESHKTVDMIADRARKLADTIQAVKNRDVRRLEFMFPGKRTKQYPKRVVVWDDGGNPITRQSGKTVNRYGRLPTRPLPTKMDDATRLWLEYRYGWTPLVYDIVDSLKAIYADDLRKELTQRERFTARGKASQQGLVTSTSVSPNWAFGSLTASTEASHDYTVRSYILYKFSSDTSMRRLNDFGAFDVPRAIWELVPWSFVVDWFIPIGDFLGALSPKVGVEVLASGYEISYNLTVKRSCASWVSNPSSGNLMWNTAPIPIGAAESVVMTDVVRYPHLDLPTFPPLEVKINLKKMVDAVALFRGVHQRSSLRI